MKRFITKKLVALGLSASAALSAGYLIVPWEGSRTNSEGLHVVYADPIGIPTYCYGRTGKDLYGKVPKIGDTYTEDECVTMLADSVRHFEKQVDGAVKVDYSSPYQRAALISFTYNVGEGNLRSSTLVRLINQGKHEEACEQLTRWVNAGGKPLQGLINRRAGEMVWCLGGVSQEIKDDYASLKEGGNIHISTPSEHSIEVATSLIKEINEPVKELSFFGKIKRWVINFTNVENK